MEWIYRMIGQTSKKQYHESVSYLLHTNGSVTVPRDNFDMDMLRQSEFVYMLDGAKDGYFKITAHKRIDSNVPDNVVSISR